MEGDSPMRDCWIPLCLFQSTPSAWRETSHTVTAKLAVGKFQSTPSAWRETVSFPPSLGVDSYFNPLPPHGGRLFDLESDAILGDFNPLPPHGGRLIIDILKAERLTISIHSLRMEGDSENLFAAVCRNDISIHSLRMEGDHFIGCAVCIDCISIHSLRMEGDYQLRGDQHVYFISIHSLRMEGDNDFKTYSIDELHFNPLPPHGGRHTGITFRITEFYFNPLPPHGGRHQRKHQSSDF